MPVYASLHVLQVDEAVQQWMRSTGDTIEISSETALHDPSHKQHKDTLLRMEGGRTVCVIRFCIQVGFRVLRVLVFYFQAVGFFRRSGSILVLSAWLLQGVHWFIDTLVDRVKL